MKNKKLIILIPIIVVIIIFIILFHYFRIKNAKVVVKLKTPRVVEVYDEVHASNFIDSLNGTLINDPLIDTSKIGNSEVNISFLNSDKIKVGYTFQVKIEDNTPPIIGVSNYTVVKGYSDDLSKVFFCGDNYDNTPSCRIEGNYDTNRTGSYSLVFKAVDSSGNENKANFTLNVEENLNNKKIIRSKHIQNLMI